MRSVTIGVNFGISDTIFGHRRGYCLDAKVSIKAIERFQICQRLVCSSWTNVRCHKTESEQGDCYRKTITTPFSLREHFRLLLLMHGDAIHGDQDGSDKQSGSYLDKAPLL